MKRSVTAPQWPGGPLREHVKVLTEIRKPRRLVDVPREPRESTKPMNLAMAVARGCGKILTLSSDEEEAIGLISGLPGDSTLAAGDA